MVRGYYAYHAVPTNYGSLKAFQRHVVRIWLRALRSRSQKDRTSWKRMYQLTDEESGSNLPPDLRMEDVVGVGGVGKVNTVRFRVMI